MQVRRREQTAQRPASAPYASSHFEPACSRRWSRAQLVVRRLLRAAQRCGACLQARNPPTVAPGGPQEAKKMRHIYARTYARKPSRNKVRLNASRTSKRRASGCLRMCWRRNELFWFICNSVYYRTSLRSASQNKIDDGGKAK